MRSYPPGHRLAFKFYFEFFGHSVINNLHLQQKRERETACRVGSFIYLPNPSTCWTSNEKCLLGHYTSITKDPMATTNSNTNTQQGNVFLKNENGDSFAIPSSLGTRCKRIYKWNDAFADTALTAYHQFIKLKLQQEDWNATILSPSLTVNKVWQQHILQVQHYVKACQDYTGGELIGYDPEEGSDKVARAKRVEATKLCLKTLFGKKDVDAEAWKFGDDTSSEKDEVEGGGGAPQQAAIRIEDDEVKEVKEITKYEPQTEEKPAAEDTTKARKEKKEKKVTVKEEPQQEDSTKEKTSADNGKENKSKRDDAEGESPPPKPWNEIEESAIYEVGAMLMRYLVRRIHMQLVHVAQWSYCHGKGVQDI